MKEHEKNCFLKIFKNLVRSKNNFVWTIKIIVYNIDDSAAKSFNILATSLNVLHNYFDSAAKSFNILATSLNVLHNYFDSLSKIICKSVSN